MGQPQTDASGEALSVEAFTDFFDAGPAQAVPRPTLEAVADRAQAGVSLEEASHLLNLHVDTIKKRLRKGTLKGFKVQEKFGEKWVVIVEELPRPREAVADLTLEAVPDPTQDASCPTPEAVPDFSPALERLVTALEKKDGVIESQAHQLKAAGDVIMYLRSQLEEKETQLKLLTDSQHKTGWWTRFNKWFMGR